MSTETSVSREDLELIAAVLDGRLSGKARSAALERIEADEALREVFAESARFLGEEEATSGLADPPAAQATTVHFWKVALPIAIAATLAAVLITWPRDWTARPAADYAKKLAGVGELNPGWDAPPSTDRGDAEAAQWFSVGAELVQLEVALRKGDQEKVHEKAKALQKALDQDLAFTQGLADGLMRVLVSEATLEKRLEEAHELDRVLLAQDDGDRVHYALGKWAEAGWLGAKMKQQEVFDWKFRTVADQAAQHQDLDPEVRKALENLAEKLREQPKPADLTGLQRDFGALIEAASK